jgi:hypothetical protein
VSGVIQCFHFGARERGSAGFERGKERVRRLLIPMWRGDRRMQQRDGVRHWAAAGVGQHLD